MGGEYRPASELPRGLVGLGFAVLASLPGDRPVQRAPWGHSTATETGVSQGSPVPDAPCAPTLPDPALARCRARRGDAPESAPNPRPGLAVFLVRGEITLAWRQGGSLGVWPDADSAEMGYKRGKTVSLFSRQ